MQTKFKKLKSLGFFLLFGGVLALMVACGSEPKTEPEVEDEQMVMPIEPIPLDSMHGDTMRREMDTLGSGRPKTRLRT